MVEFKAIQDIEPGALLADLKRKPLRDLQRVLAFLAYLVGVIDGLYGPRTRNAWSEFKTELGEGNPDIVSEGALDKLTERTAALTGILAPEVANKEQIKDVIQRTCVQLGLGLKPQIAYVLATTEWETAHTFQPVKEAFWLSEAWRKTHLHYYPYYGRGYVQLTWKRNYENYGAILDEDLVEKPDRALIHPVALFVLVHGFRTGTFTGRRLTDFVSKDKVDFISARRCINGTDKASEIATLAEKYLDEI
jgi:hypothetical protein